MEKKSLSQQTADRLYTMIVVEHRLSPGEKLPSEVELARELGVTQHCRLLVVSGVELLSDMLDELEAR